MAGSGKKTFTAGDVLTASDVNNYLMDQTVMVFGGTAARSSAIPTPSEGMFAVTTDNDELGYYNGSAWVPASRMGDWTTFTPSMTNFNIGSTGTVSAAYVLVGKTLFVRAQFVLGGTGISIGTASMTLPGGYTAKSRTVAPCMIVDQGTAFFSGLTYSNGTSVTIYVNVASGTYTSLSTISSSIPMTWVATDELQINLAIEVN
jgi:hypothetical protein